VQNGVGAVAKVVDPARLRDELLNGALFMGLPDARQKLEAWPNEFAAQIRTERRTQGEGLGSRKPSRIRGNVMSTPLAHSAVQSWGAGHPRRLRDEITMRDRKRQGR
jgi:hypothetical protein